MSFASPPPFPRRRRPALRLLVAGLALAVLAGAGYLLLADRFAPPLLREPQPSRADAPNAMLLFTMNCAACHQTSGEGVAGMYPPLAGSEWVSGDERVLANILLHGVEGEMTVRGARYAGTMPAFWRLSDVELAAVATYARSTWSNKAPPVTAELFAAQRGARPPNNPFAGERELRGSATPAR